MNNSIAHLGKFAKRLAASCLLVASATVLLMAPATAAAKPPSGLATTFESKVEVRTHGNESAIKSGADSASTAQDGTEAKIAKCPHAFIRSSHAEGVAAAVIEEPPSEQDPMLPEIKIVLSVKAAAQGGGYRTCNLCPGLCVGLHPHDTSAVATATVTARARIPAPTDLNQVITIQLRRIVAGPSGKALRITIEDGEGHLVSDNPRDDEPIRLEAAAGRTYIVIAQLQASASDTGTCCNATTRIDAGVAIALLEGAESTDLGERTLRPGRPAPRMVQAEHELGYPQVGMVLRKGKFVCTGTLIGSTTVLTAAHCIANLPYKKTDYAFRVGQGYDDKGSQDYNVIDSKYPGPEVGYAYDEIIFADDIALLYLASQPLDPSSHGPLEPFALYTPVSGVGLEPLRKNKLHFVGYGYSRPDPDTADTKQITRRFLDMSISSDGARVFTNEDEPHNTCVGDSGGPALRIDVDPPQVVGVISHGDPKCHSYGNNTRVDFYSAWLSGRVH